MRTIASVGAFVFAGAVLLTACDKVPASPTSGPAPGPRGVVEPVIRDVPGAHTLTIRAADECGTGLGAGNLPEELKVRSYTATVKPWGSKDLGVTLSGMGFFFWGTIDPTGVVFSLHNADDGQPIIERLSTSKALGIEGHVVASTGRDTRFAGTLAGEFRLFETKSRRDGDWVPIAWCTSSSHSFVLSR